jgi:hypothetical protein
MPPVSHEPPQAGPGMILTPDQRLRLFVSSTLEEPPGERVAARRAIQRLRPAPVWYESGARPGPPRSMYRAYLEQSQVFEAGPAASENTAKSRISAIFTGSVAGNRSTLISLAKFEVLFNRVGARLLGGAGWEPKWEPTCTAIRRRQATSSHDRPR